MSCSRMRRFSDWNVSPSQNSRFAVNTLKWLRFKYADTYAIPTGNTLWPELFAADFGITNR